jgi:enamine deaminase RidA (YjgF/YER057c/UK114 family)
VDCEGGGQVWVEGNTMFVSHMRPPYGTSIYDVADPRRPRLLASLEVPMGWHSHKVRAKDGLMIVNYEKFRVGADDFGGGLGIYDVSRPDRPRLIKHWKTGTEGGGVHRYDFDGRYAYISPTAPGFVGNIVKILDLQEPSRPEEVGSWWIPGQNMQAGEHYPWDNYVPPRCHHPLRMGNRLYVSYWHHGMFILDIEDLSRPKLVSQFNTGPAHPHPTHTALPIPMLLKGRQILVVADEDVAKLRPGCSTSPMNASPFPSRRSRSMASTRTALPKSLCQAVTSPQSASRAASCPLPGSRAACAWSTSATLSGPEKSATTSPTRRPGSSGSHRTTSRPTRAACSICWTGSAGWTSSKALSTETEMAYLQQAFGKKNPNLPFHPAVRAGDFVFVSGQVAKDENGVMQEGTIEQLTRSTIEAMRRALQSAGCDLADVVKVTTYLEDARDFGRYNGVFKEYFPDGMLARTTVEARAVIDTKIEIECMAYKPL